MSLDYYPIVAAELGIASAQVQATASLLAEGATVPFIARYRKERTDSLDEVAIASIRDRLEALIELDKRKASIIKSLEEQNVLSEELARRIGEARSLPELEDLYLPYRPKRKTRASVAREKGLEPLAMKLLRGRGDQDADAVAEPYVHPESGVETVADALTGARDIIAELFSEDARVRSITRKLFSTKGVVASKVVKGREKEAQKFRDYYDWHERADRVPSHRVLAVLRGEREKHLRLKIEIPAELVDSQIKRQFIRRDVGPSFRAQIDEALEAGYKRLLAPSISTETWAVLKENADRAAIEVFSSNLRELLLSPPLGPKPVLALDPGFRTGCKLVCVNAQGALEHYDTIYPHNGNKQSEEAAAKIRDLCTRFHIQAIAIGNGTAGRETEAFVRKLDLPSGPAIVLVNESGASVYSASDVARLEFPDHDVTVRGSVSIARRLMDPLAELIKIDPKSIGVGQYQHDVDQKALQRSLNDTVMSCVNAVGVDVNTSSKELLTYVSGLGPVLAANIVTFRNEHGSFTNRSQLNSIPRLGTKAFEQCAGFLRIRGGDTPLDASAVHPESYHVVTEMAQDLRCTVRDLIESAELRRGIDLRKYATDSVGLPTLRDVMSELAKPGRDPRDEFDHVSFDEEVNSIKDVQPGMRLTGVVTNVTAFGAFVDIGVHQDGLIHISEMADRFVRDPSEIVKVQQKVSVVVLDVDADRKRISLSMRSNQNGRD